MSNNVIPFGRGAVGNVGGEGGSGEPPTPNKYIIEVLEIALERAKAGETTSLAIGYTTGGLNGVDGMHYRAWLVDDTLLTILLHGVMSTVCAEMMQTLIDNSCGSDDEAG